jgi:hypothetical protein
MVESPSLHPVEAGSVGRMIRPDIVRSVYATSSRMARRRRSRARRAVLVALEQRREAEPDGSEWPETSRSLGKAWSRPPLHPVEAASVGRITRTAHRPFGLCNLEDQSSSLSGFV